MSSSKGPGCGQIFAWGCGGLLLITSLIPALLGSGGGLGIVVAAVIIGVIIFAVRSNKKEKTRSEFLEQVANRPSGSVAPRVETSEFEYSPDSESPKPLTPPKSSAPRADGAPNVAAKTIGSATGKSLSNPLCEHTFTRTEVVVNSNQTCPCGNHFSSADLLEYDRLMDLLVSTESKLTSLEKRMQATAKDVPLTERPVIDAAEAKEAGVVYHTRLAAQPEPLVPFTPAPRVKTPKPEKPKIARPKVALSLQQWLIIGASLLVVVAGSVFVATYRDKWNSQEFLIFTTLVAAATAFGGFKTRNISVLLSNFLAAFSSSMQLASMSIIGDIFSPAFTWDTMPAWYWTVSLFVVAGLAAVLAKFSRNFGWKGIAMLSLSGAALILEIGVLRDMVGPSAVVVHLAVASLFAAGILAFNRLLRSFPHPAAQSPEHEEYENNLAKLADNGLFQFGRIAAGLTLVVAVGLILMRVGILFVVPFVWWSTLLLAAVWILLSFLRKAWAGQLSTSDDAASIVGKITPAVIYISLAATVVEAAWRIPLNLLGLNVIVTVLGLGGLVFMASAVKWFKPSLNQVTATIGVGAVLWLIWNNAVFTIGQQPAALAGFLIGMGLVLNLNDYLFKVTRFEWAGAALNGLAMVLYLANIGLHKQFALGSAGYGALVLLLIVLANLQSVLRWVIKGRTGTTRPKLNNWIALGTSAALTLGVLVQVTDSDALRPTAFIFLLYSLGALALSVWGPLKKQGAVLNAHAYLGHLIPVVVVLESVTQHGNRDAGVNSLLIALLAVLNYGFGAFRKQSIRMQLGFAAAFAAFWIEEFAATTDASVGLLALQIAVVGIAAFGHSWLLRKRAGQTGFAQNLASMIALPLGLVLNLLSFWGHETQDQKTYSLVLLIALTAGSTVVNRVAAGRLFTGASSLVQVALFSYGVYDLMLAYADQSGDIKVGQWQLLVALLVLTLALRLRNKKFSSAPENAIFYVLNLWAGVIAGLLTFLYLPNLQGPEGRTIWIAAALAISTLFAGRDLGVLRRILLVDLPVLGFAVVSLSYALGATNLDANVFRGVLSLLVISAYSYYRSGTMSPAPWLIVGYLSGAGAALWLTDGFYKWFNWNFDGPEIYAAMAALSVFVGNFFLKKRVSANTMDLRYIVLTGTLAVPSLAYALQNNLSPIVNDWRAVGALALIVALAYWRTAKAGLRPWIAAAYLAAFAEALAISHLILNNWLTNFEGPEIVSILVTGSVLATHTIALPHLKPKGTLFTWDLPVGILTVPSLVYSVLQGSTSVADQWREILALLVITGLAYLRTQRTGQLGWIAGAYASAVAEALAIGHSVTISWLPNFSGPEVFSVLVTGAVLATHTVALKKLKPAGTLFRWDIPVGILTLPSLVYALINGSSTAADQWREVLALLVITGLAYLRTRQTGHIGWIAGAYVAALSEALALGHVLSTNLFKDFHGPEVYSLVAGAAVFATHAVALKKLKLQGTLFSWGLPVAVLLVPSIIYTYWSLNLPFDQLDGLQITRMLAALVASIVLLVVGIRLGNLANATMGLVGLTLDVLPNIALHTTKVTAASQVETTSLVFGMLVFVGLWLFGRYGTLKGNSRLFIGVPVVIALAPTMVRALMALASPELSTIDWWRFSIVLAASMTLLIIGSLRELAGMFYPGLVSLLLSALPYGFKQSQSTGWLLWVMLLLVAGVMVWLAVRLERLKKAGRTSAAWLKELK